MNKYQTYLNSQLFNSSMAHHSYLHVTSFHSVFPNSHIVKGMTTILISILIDMHEDTVRLTWLSWHFIIKQSLVIYDHQCRGSLRHLWLPWNQGLWKLILIMLQHGQEWRHGW